MSVGPQANVGPLVKTKFIWLLDNVQVKGVVRYYGPDGLPISDGIEVGAGDDFDLEPDANYRHLIALLPGNNPLIWYKNAAGCIHCETYPPAPEQINRVESWPIERKPDNEPFSVVNVETGQRERLKTGQHVEVVGRWVIDHHPEHCNDETLGLKYDRPCRWIRLFGEVGLLAIGRPHIELHPFRWDNIKLVIEPRPTEARIETLSLAAPLWEEQFLGLGKWLANEAAGVAGRIFLTDNASNFHRKVSATAVIKAPQLPVGFHADRRLLDVSETVLVNGTGRDRTAVRSITVLEDGIRVQASVEAPNTSKGGVPLADINDPANDRSVFQARYSVRWLPRLIVEPLGTESRVFIEAEAGSMRPFDVEVENRAPDPVEITGVELSDQSLGVFRFDTPLPARVAAHSRVKIWFRFAPPQVGTFQATVKIATTDPAHPQIDITQLAGTGIPPRPRARFEVSANALGFGPVRVGTVAERLLTIRNVGTRDGSISNFRLDPDSDEFRILSELRGVAAGSSYDLRLAFAPARRGVKRTTANVIAGGIDASDQQFDVLLEGSGIAPKIAVTPDSLDFGALQAGDTKIIQVTVRNDGDAPLRIAEIYLPAVGSVRGFNVTAATGLPLVVAPGASTSLDVTYTASLTPGDPSTERWVVMSDDPITPAVFLTLRGLSCGPRIAVEPDFVDLGLVRQRGVMANVVIRNDGSAALSVDSVRLRDGANLRLVGAPVRRTLILPSSHLQFQIALEPSGPGQYNDALIVESNDARRRRVVNLVQAIWAP